MPNPWLLRRRGAQDRRESTTRILLAKAGLRYAAMVAVRVKRDDCNSYERRPDLRFEEIDPIEPPPETQEYGDERQEGSFEAGYADQLPSNLVMRLSMAHPNLLARFRDEVLLTGPE